MKTIAELNDKDDPYINVFNRYVSEASNKVTVFSPSDENEAVLLNVQVTTHSALGSIIYHTGGVSIDDGWVRLLGSGSESIPRNIHDWNNGLVKGIYLVGDDAAGGFFAINGGGLPGEHNIVHYWSPDSFEWESLELIYSDFLRWILNANLNEYYEGVRWSNWKQDIMNISSEKCVSFYPPLWTEEGSCENSQRGIVPIKEALEVKCDFMSKI